jgi:UDP-glucuronate 4-epimerase
MKLLVTGAAGFIGYHTLQKLLEQSHEVIGIDNLNDCYDVSLKEHRLARLNHPQFKFHKIDLTDNKASAICLNNTNLSA